MGILNTRICWQTPDRERSPGTLGHPPIDPFQEHRQLRRCDRHLAIGGRRPHETSLLQPLAEQACALAVKPDHFDQIAAPPSEHKQVPRERVFCQRLLRQGGQSVESLPHVSDASCQPDLGLRRNRDHRISPSTRAKTPDSAVGPSTKIRRPSVNVISIR